MQESLPEWKEEQPHQRPGRGLVLLCVVGGLGLSWPGLFLPGAYRLAVLSDRPQPAVQARKGFSSWALAALALGQPPCSASPRP